MLNNSSESFQLSCRLILYYDHSKLTDKGIEPQSTDDEGNSDKKEKAKLTLTIKKFNYYPPVFVFPNKSGQSFSLTAVSTKKVVIKAVNCSNFIMPGSRTWNPTCDVLSEPNICQY